MSNIAGLRASLLASLAAATLAACGSSSSGASQSGFAPPPQLDTIEAQLQKADGSFTRGKETALFTTFDAQLAQATIIPGLSKAPPVATKSQPSNADPIAANTSSFCPDMAKQDAGSCACPDGGSIAWKASGGAQASLVTMQIKLSACALGDFVEDGAIYASLSGSTNGYAATLDEIVDYHTTITHAGQTTRADFELDVQNTTARMTVKSDDGTLVFLKNVPWTGSAPPPSDTSYDVVANNGSYQCTRWASGSGTCSGPVQDNRTF
jgi:hypothetical protein